MGLWQWFREGLQELLEGPESENERRYLELLAERDPLTDEQFYDTFCAGSDIPRELVADVRDELQSLLGYNIQALHPEDNIAVNFDGLDFAVVLWRMERRFKVKLPYKTLPCEVDGTFETLVATIHRRQQINKRNSSVNG